MSKTKNKSDNKTEKALAAEKEQFGKQQVRNYFREGILLRLNQIVFAIFYDVMSVYFSLGI